MVALGDLLNRWHKYSARYGAAHAVIRFIGTRVPLTWSLCGPLVSRGYRMKWVDTPGTKIINLGGGGNCLDGCLTIDTDPRSDTYVDCRKPLPFVDASIDGIFCEEVIEHISKADGYRMLRECRRIMKSGATIRLTTPDLDWFCRALLDETISCDEINDIFYKHAHVHLYSRKELVLALRACGFADVRHSCYKDSKARFGYLDSHPVRFNHSPDISQYIEARRSV